MGKVAQQLDAENLRRWRSWILPPLVAVIAVRVIFGGLLAGIDSPLEFAAKFLFGAIIASITYMALSLSKNRPTTTTDPDGADTVPSTGDLRETVFDGSLTLSSARWEALSAQIREGHRRLFHEKYGRDPGSRDSLPPLDWTPEELQQLELEAVELAGFEPAYCHAVATVGIIPRESNLDSLDPYLLSAFQAAYEEYSTHNGEIE